jgi:hypothetical protein
MQAVEVTSVSEIPNNSYGCAAWLRIFDPKICDALNHAQHTPADKRVIHHLSYVVVVDVETVE